MGKPWSGQPGEARECPSLEIFSKEVTQCLPHPHSLAHTDALNPERHTTSTKRDIKLGSIQPEGRGMTKMTSKVADILNESLTQLRRVTDPSRTHVHTYCHPQCWSSLLIITKFQLSVIKVFPPLLNKSCFLLHRIPPSPPYSVPSRLSET